MQKNVFSNTVYTGHCYGILLSEGTWMLKEIILPEDRFEEDKITNLKQKNFIFGKNGTGKSSIATAIQEQSGAEYDVRVFQGFNSVVHENGVLNAISLGATNAELQPQIEDIQIRQIPKLQEEVDSASKANTEALQEKDNFEKKLSNIYSNAASKLKNKHTELTGANYNKNHFRNDVSSAYRLSEQELENTNRELKQERIDGNPPETLNWPNVISLCKEANEVISKDIVEIVSLNFANSEQQEWVERGLELYRSDDICAFCGNKISRERISQLRSYFNDEVNSTKDKINGLKEKIDDTKRMLNVIDNIDSSLFYPNFSERLLRIKDDIVKCKNEYRECLEKLEEKLEEKKKNIFLPLDRINIVIPASVETTRKEYEELVADNKNFAEELNQKVAQAKKKLLRHYVASEVDSSNLVDVKDKLEEANEKHKTTQKEYDEKSEELQKKEEELRSLLSRTVDESRAANDINEKLSKSLGNQSFRLETFAVSGQRGQYQIRGYDGVVRDISTLSTGEKNIVAFLWFMNSLKDTKDYAKKRIIIFDDPMNSNDDTTQYLIISQLQELMRNIGNNQQIFILTHNTHFYLNVRYKWWYGSKKPTYNKTTYHLHKDGFKTSVVMITSEQDDIKTSYDALWEEIHWLYREGKPSYMLNSIRRVFETYAKFMDIENIYESNLEAQKLFNVNSHSIDDYTADLNGKTADDIINLVKQVFEHNGAISHFNKHWQDNENV